MNERDLIIRVHPQTAPQRPPSEPCGYCRRCAVHDDPGGCLTVEAAFRHATHRDATGMPVAIYRDPMFGDNPYHPTPCCGTAASISDPAYGMFCKACYEKVDAAYGNVPVKPFTPISPSHALRARESA